MIERVNPVVSRPREKRIPLSELGARCHKLGHPQFGTWMARRIARPLALRVTWVVAPWGISAHSMTLAAGGLGLAAASAFGLGNQWGWLVGAVFWQLCYLLDHVDGQLARLHRTESLDGAQLDYWMHHVVNLCIPCGMGCGLFVRATEPAWLLAGFGWGLALLVVGLEPDTRAKSFILRLKRLSGELRVVGGGGGRPGPAARPPRTVSRRARWMVRKLLEMHVLMNFTSALALVQLLLGDGSLVSGRAWVATMSALAVLGAVAVVVRSVRSETAEREFAAWFRLSPHTQLVYQNGWWVVHRGEGGEHDQVGKRQPADCPRSS